MENPKDKTHNLSLKDLAVFYTDINADKLGNKCGFWYKHINSKPKFLMKNKPDEKVSFNNCCFAFYVSKRNYLYEVCVHPDGKENCRRKSMEVMVTMKDFCESIQELMINNSQKEDSSTLDNIKEKLDSEDNKEHKPIIYYQGKAYIADLFNNSHKAQINPSDMAVDSNSILVTGRQGSIEDSVSIQLEDIQFSCGSENFCPIQTFLNNVQKKDASHFRNANIVIGTFQSEYPFLKNKVDADHCLVVETIKKPYLICVIDNREVAKIQKSISTTIDSNTTVKPISSMQSPISSDVFTISILTDNIVNSQAKFSTYGLTSALENVNK